jgi:hypothetical protein
LKQFLVGLIMQFFILNKVNFDHVQLPKTLSFSPPLSPWFPLPNSSPFTLKAY